MKRNSIFMWAYITFIIVTILLRLFVDYSLWSAVVLAVCFSSVLFSIEDMFLSFSNSAKESHDILVKFLEGARENLEADFEFFNTLECAYQKYKDTKHDVSDVYDAFEPQKKQREQAYELTKIMEERDQLLVKRKKIYSSFADAFAYAGFLLLFCMLVFASFITISLTTQEIFTVLSFAIILATRQFDERFRIRINKERENSQTALQSQIDASKKLMNSKEKLDELIRFIESVEEKSKGLEYAD